MSNEDVIIDGTWTDVTDSGNKATEGTNQQEPLNQNVPNAGEWHNVPGARPLQQNVPNAGEWHEVPKVENTANTNTDNQQNDNEKKGSFLNTNYDIEQRAEGIDDDMAKMKAFGLTLQQQPTLEPTPAPEPKPQKKKPSQQQPVTPTTPIKQTQSADVDINLDTSNTSKKGKDPNKGQQRKTQEKRRTSTPENKREKREGEVDLERMKEITFRKEQIAYIRNLYRQNPDIKAKDIEASMKAAGIYYATGSSKQTKDSNKSKQPKTSIPESKDKKEPVDIPAPLKEVMNKILDENYNFRPGMDKKENGGFNLERLKEQFYLRQQMFIIRDLEKRTPSMSDAEIERKLRDDETLYMIKRQAASHIKGQITMFFRDATHELVKADPNKYSQYYNPTTGEVVGLDGEEVIGKILAQTAYSKWFPDAYEWTPKPGPTPIEGEDDEEDGESIAIKIRLEQQQTMISYLQTEIDATRAEIDAVREEMSAMREEMSAVREGMNETKEQVENIKMQIANRDQIIINMLEREKQREAEEKERRRKKTIAIISGIFAFGAGVVCGPKVAIAGAMISGVGTLVTKGISLFAGWRINKKTKELQETQDPTRKAQIQDVIEAWRDLDLHTKRISSFFLGTGIGFGVSSLFTKVFMGGQGLLNRTYGESLKRLSGVTSPKSAESFGSQLNPKDKIFQDSNLIKPPVQETPVTGIETGGEGILLRNGRVHLPGSAWNGNLATPPTGNLPGGQFLSSNFVGGATNMGAFNLESALQSYHVSREAIDALGTQRTHQLLNLFRANPRIDLLDALNQLGIDKALLGL